MNVLNIFNTIRANSSALYQERIDVATAQNFTELGGTIVEYSALRNEFCDALVNKILYQSVKGRRFKNPLAFLKTGRKPFGNGADIEDMYVNPAKAVQYDGTATQRLLEIVKPDVKTMYHRQNRKDQYIVSITIPELQKAFLSLENFEKFLTAKINSLYSGDEIDEFLLMKQVFTSAVEKGYVPSTSIDYDGGEQSCKELIKLVKTLSGNFTLPSTQYNGYSLLNAEKITAEQLTACTTWTPKENQFILIRTDVDASTDVEVLAKAFNMEKAEFLKRKHVIDSFGDTDTLLMIGDDALPEFHDDLYTMEEFHNGATLTKTYYLHHWQTLSISLFGNAYAIKANSTASASVEPETEQEG